MAKRTRTTRSARRVAMEELEPRQLLSADLVPLPADPAPLSNSLLSESIVSSLLTDQPAATGALLADRHEVVFVDSGVPNLDSLLADLNQNSNGSRRFEIIVLDASRDGIVQVTEALADRVQVDAVHFITHGTDGAIQLGSSWLNANTLAANIEAVASWGHALKHDGDLLFYGCDLAGSARGRALIDRLADLTQTDVAASADATGSAVLGGNWTLEFTTGAIKTQVAVSAEEQAQWNNVLASEQLDWDAVDWTTSSTTGSFTVGSGTVSIALTGSTNRLNVGYPDDTTYNTGNLSPVEQALQVFANSFQSTGEYIDITINFSHPGGVSNVSFPIFDIDTGGAGGFIDKVTVNGVNGSGTINPSSVVPYTGVTTPTWTLTGGNTLTGNSPANNTGAGAQNGTAVVTFNQSGITQITLRYQNNNPGFQQAIGIHDIIFTANRAPVLATGSTLAYTENQAAAPINTSLTVSDVDNSTLASATVSVSGNFASGQDVLGFVNGAGMGNIAGSYNSGTGVLTLTSAGATATLAEWQIALRAVTYYNSSDAPSTLARTVSYTVNDGLINSNTVTSTVNVIAVNDAPVLADTVVALASVNEDAAVPSGAVGTLVSTLVGGQTDPDGASALKGIAITATDTNGTWYYSTNNGGNWTTFTGSVAASRLLAADANTRIYFRPNANFNGTISDAITFRAWDQTSGANGGTANTSTNGGTTAFSMATDTASIVVVSVNDAPVGTNRTISMPDNVLYTYTAADFGFTDPNDSPPNAFTGVRVVTVPAGTATLRLNGALVTAGTTISIADINAGRFQYQADTGNRSWTFRVIDDGGTANGGIDMDATARTMTMNTNQNANDAPVLADTVLGISLVEDAGIPSGAVGSLVSAFTGGITDPDSATAPKGIALIASDETNGTWYFTIDNGSTWTPVGAVSTAQSLLLADNGLTRLYFAPNADYNGSVASGVTMRAWDQTSGIAATKVSTATTGGTTAFSGATDTIAVTVSAVNDAPVFTGTASGVTFTENGAAVSLVSGATVSDVDASNFNGGSVTVAFTAYVVGDVLSINNQGSGAGQIGVSGANVTYGGVTIGTFAGGSAANLVISLNGNAIPTAVQALIGQLRYASTSEDPTVNGTATTRALTITLNDGGNTGAGGALTANQGGIITIAPLTDAPVIGGAGSTRSYTENAAAVTLEPALTVTDVDDTQIASGSVTISAGSFVAGDTLTWTNQAGITANYNSGTGVLTLTGNVALATYQTLLRTVAFSSTSDDPTLNGTRTARTITWSLTDANSDSAGAGTGTATTTVNVIAVNDPPAAPGLDLLAISDTGASSTDDLTNDATPDIRVTLNGTGDFAPAVGDTVNIYSNAVLVGGVVLTAPDIASGFVDVTLAPLGADGVKTLTSTITDTFGDTSAPSVALPVTLDTSASLTITNPVSGNGLINGTEEGSVSISGAVTNVEDGQIVTVSITDGVNPPVVGNAAVVGGAYTVAGLNLGGLNEGLLTITASVTDIAGNSANDGASASLDRTAPGAPVIISIPENGGGGIDPAEGADGTPVLVSLTGTGAQAGDTLTITWGAQTVAYSLTGADITADSATVTVPPATITAQGGGTFNVLAAITDVAGNAGPNSAPVSVTVIVPVAPSLSLNGSGTAAQDFATADYSAGSGTIPWSGPWSETNDNGSATTGDVRIENGYLVFQNISGGVGPSLTRSIDLSGANSATLSFDFEIPFNGIDSVDAIQIQLSSDGVSFTTLETFTGIDLATNGSRSYDISAFASANTTIRFQITNEYFGADEEFRVDNLLIDATFPNYATTYTEDDPPIAIAGSMTQIIDSDSTDLSQAHIVLTNPQTGDTLSIAGALPAGITATTLTSNEIVLTGSATLADYETAIEQICFSSSSQNPATVNRIIEVTVTDNTSQLSNTATSTITVVAVDDPPIAQDDALATTPGTAINGNVLSDNGTGADSDPEGASLYVDTTPVSGPSNGILVMNSDGSFTYTPNGGFLGTDSFVYRVRDALDTPGLNFEYFDVVPAGPSVDNIPAPGTGNASGIATDFDVDTLVNGVDPGDLDQFSIRYIGYIEITTGGTYTFQTGSDDGSKLYVDGTQVVNNDGDHAYQTQSGAIALTAGRHAIVIEFYENGGAEDLTVFYSGPDTGASLVDLATAGVLYTTTGGLSDTATVTITVADVIAQDDGGITDEDSVLTVAAPGVLGNDTNTVPAMTAGATLIFDATLDTDGDGTWEDENNTTNGGNVFDWVLGAFGTESTYNTAPGSALPGITATYSFTGNGSSGGTMPSFQSISGDPTSNSASFELWFRPQNATNTAILFETGAGADGTVIYLEGSEIVFATRDNGSAADEVRFDLSTAIGGGDPTAEFIQVVGVLDLSTPATGVRMYVNGSLLGTTVLNGVDWAGASGSALGTDSNGSPFGTGDFIGDIARFRFYESALTNTQVQANYESVATQLTVTQVNGNPANVGVQIALASGALLTVNGDGSYSYNPNGQFESLAVGDTASDSFTYTASDAIGNSDAATVTITVTAVDDPTVTASDSNSTLEDTTLTVAAAAGVLANDTDVDNALT
ncbi:MAG: DUF4347 domain-containing protein, partial [Burkholderiales bacterium]